MRAFTFVEHIARPPERVWATLVDLSLAPRWRPLTKSMQTLDGQPVHAGTQVRVTIEFYGQIQERVSSTVVFVPGREWVLHSSDKPGIEGFFRFLVEPDPSGSGTRVTATCELKAHSFLYWLFLPLIARGERQRRVELLPNLKLFVEGRT